MRTPERRLSRTVTVEHLAHGDTAIDELGARRLDVGYDEIEFACRARHGRRAPGAELDRARRAWRRELDAPKRVTDHEVGIESPAQAAVETLGAIDVRNRDDHDLELHIDRSSRGCDVSFDHSVELVHDSLLVQSLRAAAV